MAREIGIKDRRKWRGYLSEHGPVEQRPKLTPETIKSVCADLKDELVAPDNPRMDAIVVDVSEGGVIIRIPGGERTIAFDEIIRAEVVIRYWLANALAPVWADFREPQVASVTGISNSSYAPA